MKIFAGHINGTKPVIVDFSAAWSNPDKLMTPILEEIKEKLGDRVTVLHIDTEREPGYKKLYEINTLPTVILFNHGHVIWRKSGIVTAHEILEHLIPCL